MIIYVVGEEAIKSVDPEHVLAYLFGMSRLEPVTVQVMNGLSTKLDLDTIANGTGERYLCELDGQRVEIPAKWVIPFAAGLAARHGDSLELAEQASERRRRMQALMTSHQRGWLVYVEIIEGIEGERS